MDCRSCPFGEQGKIENKRIGNSRIFTWVSGLEKIPLVRGEKDNRKASRESATRSRPLKSYSRMDAPSFRYAPAASVECRHYGIIGGPFISVQLSL